MRAKKYLQLVVLGGIASLLFSCADQKTDNEKQIITVSISPQKYFVERIGGKYLDVEVMVKQGQNPATYEPTPIQISKLGNTSAFFSIGVPFENAFLNKISSNIPNLNLVDTSVGITKRNISEHTHKEDSELENHSITENPDPHIWMSPVLVQNQASIILKALIKLKPEYTSYFTENYNKFISDLKEINLELKNILSDYKCSTMFVYHPSFGYFADLYGLKQLAIEEAGKEPSPRILEKIIKSIIADNVKIIFVQPEFQSSSINVITKATGAAVISVNPLSYNYLENLRYIATTLGKEL